MPYIPADHATFYGTLQRLVNSGEMSGAVSQAVIRSAEVARAGATNEVLEAALKAGDPEAVVRAIFNPEIAGEEAARMLRAGRFQELLERLSERDAYASVLSGVRAPIQSVSVRAAAVALEELPRPAGPISRAAVEIRATAAASKRAGDLVTSVARETQLAVRELTQQALMEGRSVKQAARSIREVIGLNRQQAKSFDKFMSEAMESDAHKSAAGVQRAIDREYKRLINQRADTIARTELWQAGQDGQIEAWREAQASGALDIRGLDSVFVSKLGERSRGPLHHPKCFCSVRLRAETPGGERYYVREWVTSPRNPCPKCIAFQGARALPA